jgi:hypothetical protein
MSTSEPSPPTELASSPAQPSDPLREDSAKAPDPLGLTSDAEPDPTDSDLRAFDALPARGTKKEPALADSSIFDVSDAGAWETPPAERAIVDAPAIDAPVADAQVVEAAPAETATAEDSPPVEAPAIEESPLEASPVAPALEAPAVEAALSVDEPTGTEPLEPEPLEEKADLAAFGDLSAFDKLSPKSKSPESLAKLKVPLPPLLPPTAPQPAEASNAASGAVDLDDEAEWELSGELGSATQNDEVAQNDDVTQAIAIAKPAEPDRPWRDVDDLEDGDGDEDDDEDSDELTGVLAKDETTDPAAPQSVAAKRAFKDVDDLEDDDDDPSEHLPTRVLGVPAPTITQRTLVPPPPSRGSARGAASALPSIPAPPTLPRSVPPSIPPVAFDWILPRAKRAGSLTLIVAGLGLLLVGVLPLVVLGGLVTGAFSPARGSLVVTVAGANHGPVQSPVVVTDDVPRCKESPCRVTNLEPGTHFVRVTAPGYQQMAPRAVTVEKGGEVVLHVELAREPSRVTVADNAPAKAQAPLDLDDPSVKLEALPKSAGASPAAAGESVRTSSAVASRAAATPAAAAVSGEAGKLNLSSTPPSNVVLDGRPLGVTPRSGIKVKPGSHSVVFIHPKHGRKSARANVKPGGTSNVSVRFR